MGKIFINRTLPSAAKTVPPVLPISEDLMNPYTTVSMVELKNSTMSNRKRNMPPLWTILSARSADE